MPLKSQFVLSGNIRDLQIQELAAGTLTAVPLREALFSELYDLGYERFIEFDPVNGFGVRTSKDTGSGEADAVLAAFGLTGTNGRASGGIDLLSTMLDRFVNVEGSPAVLIIDFSSRLIVRPDALASPEHQLFTRAQVLSHAARTRPAGPNRQPFFNSIIWIVDKEGDLPDWFLVENPKVRHIPIARPDHEARRVLAKSLVRSFVGAKEASPETLGEAATGFVDQTEGMLLLDMNAIAQLARTEGVPVTSISDAVRRYKVGVTEDPWRKIDREKVRGAEAFVKRRVKGQDHAVTHVLDVIKRAVTGVGRSNSGRPRGVAFLAGPTGVGKTELAKTITSLLFGDERAYIRFDMSEFSAEHSDQRLIGAPPGYVGYDVGGELTNAIREKPFSVILFDEIEKAHPRILDKFLQVLDDGVLTSGRGDRVYFSEAFIIFTSNLGIYKLDPSGERVPNVMPDEPFTNVESKVTAEIERHFKLVLNRPEILNRIGENIIVFDFVRPETAVLIFDQMVAQILGDVQSLGFVVSLTDNAKDQLKALCLADMSNGGRGIRNQLEAHLVNPLSRALFDKRDGDNAPVIVTGFTAGPVTSLSMSGK